MITLTFAFLKNNRVRFGALIVVIALAFTVLGVLDCLKSSMFGGEDDDRNVRLITTHAQGMTKFLPFSYIDRVSSIKGVESVGHHTWFGAYRDKKSDLMLMFAVQADVWFAQRKNLSVTPEHKSNFLATKNGLMLTEALANKYGWKVGDIVSLKSIIYSLEDSEYWQFKVSGFFRAAKDEGDRNYIIMHYDYLEQNRTYLKGTIGSLIVSAVDGEDPGNLAARIDKNFNSGENPTRTLTDKQFHAEFFNQFGDISLIMRSTIFVSFFSILMIFISTLFITVEQSQKDFAIIQLVGLRFTQIIQLIFMQAFFVSLSGFLLGVIFTLIFNGALVIFLPGNFPILHLELPLILKQFFIALVIGLFAGIIPAIAIHKGKINEVLNRDQ